MAFLGRIIELMINQYCTLFDLNYYIRFLNMYRSLCQTGHEYHIFVFPMDRKCETILHKMRLENVTVENISDFENEILLERKKERSKAEYCWTCTAACIDYVFDKYDVSELTYLDADLFFFRDPIVLLDEFHASGKDVLLIEHRYSDRNSNKEDIYGKYNVQFMTFKNNKIGREVLDWWKNSCLDWCFAVPSDGRYADQKYLDSFEPMFHCTHKLNHIGGGVAPWNVHQYSITNDCDKKPLIDDVQLVFYHFHALRVLENMYNPGTEYGVFSEIVLSEIYEPYIVSWKECVNYVNKVGISLENVYDKWDGTDFCGCILSEDLTERMRMFIERFICDHEMLAIWGYGNNGKKLAAFLKRHNITVDMIVDSDMGCKDTDIIILAPSNLKKVKAKVIITPQKGSDSIIDMLDSWGYDGAEDYIIVDYFYKELYVELFCVN